MNKEVDISWRDKCVTCKYFTLEKDGNYCSNPNSIYFNEIVRPHEHCNKWEYIYE